MAATVPRNQHVYNSPGIASHYAGLTRLTRCEQCLFQECIKPGMAILDIGVGGGRTTPFLSSLASRYVGIDYAEEMIRVCRSRFPSLDFRTMNAADLACFPDNSFDAVVMAFNAIDYVLPDRDLYRCLGECNRVLKSGGILIFSSHNPRAIVVRATWNRERVVRTARDLGGGRNWLTQSITLFLNAVSPPFALVRAIGQSSVKTFRKVRTRAFWRGEGLWLDPAHGGLITHTWTPVKCIERVERHGFQVTKYLGNDFPQNARRFVTDWYYYTFKKVCAMG